MHNIKLQPIGEEALLRLGCLTVAGPRAWHFTSRFLLRKPRWFPVQGTVIDPVYVFDGSETRESLKNVAQSSRSHRWARQSRRAFVVCETCVGLKNPAHRYKTNKIYSWPFRWPLDSLVAIGFPFLPNPFFFLFSGTCFGEGREAKERVARLTKIALRGLGRKVDIWLILPVVICLSQRLSHACLSINKLYCETANGSLNQL